LKGVFVRIWGGISFVVAGVACALAVPGWAGAAVPDVVGGASLPLNVAAAAASGGGAVRIDARVGGGDSRLCVTSSPGPAQLVAGSYPCTESAVGQRWFVDPSGQVRAAADPSQCWQVGSQSVSLQSCETRASDAQEFVFGADGTITSPARPDRCLPSAIMQFVACSHPTADQRLEFVIDPGPSSLWTWHAPQVYFTSTAAEGYVGVNSAGYPVTSATLPTNDASFYTSAVPDKPGTVYIRSYPSGDCLTAYSWSDAAMKPCLPFGNDSSQWWFIDGGQIKTGARADGSAQCLTMAWPPPGGLFIRACPNPPDWEASFGWFNNGSHLNTTLVSRDPQGTVVCLAPSQTDRTVSLANCNDQTAAYRSMVDLLPDHTIRFQQTGNCLDNYADHSDTAAQWPCNGGENQQWSRQIPSDISPLPFPVIAPINGETSRDLTTNTTALGLRVDTNPSQVTPWTIQPTQSISHCNTAHTDVRIPRTPQGRGLGLYIARMNFALQSLPSAIPYGDMRAVSRRFQTLQTALATNSTYEAERENLEDVSLRLFAQLSAYYVDVQDGQVSGVAFNEPFITAYSRVEGLNNAFLAEVQSARTDADIDPSFWQCQITVQYGR
jgi:hypothetical protein